MAVILGHSSRKRGYVNKISIGSVSQMVHWRVHFGMEQEISYAKPMLEISGDLEHY